MQIKKLLKFLPMTVITAGLAVATSTPPLSLLNNSDYLKNQIFNVDQVVDETEYTDQLQYIRNDVAKQDGVTDSVASIKLSDNSSSLSDSSAALVTKTDDSTILYMWGNNGSGQLGNGTENDTSTPTLVDSTSFGTNKITQIASGRENSAALLENGSLYMWGNNSSGQLGNGTTWRTSTPTLVSSARFTSPITQIALGNSHSAALLADGSLYMWGSNNFGQLGFTTDNTPNTTPTLVDSTPFSSKKITQIALGESHSAALLEDDSLYMWGYNYYGQLGNTTNIRTRTPNPTPTPVIAISGQKITQIALVGNYSAAIVTETDGSTLLYMWGENDYGQLGNGTTESTSTPTLVDSTHFSSRKITQIALGYQHSAALLEDGSLYMWGYNYYGQLGNGTDTDASAPAIVDSTPFGSKKIIQIAFARESSAALTEDGSLYMWGENDKGQLGFTANRTPNPTPAWMSKLGKDSHITAKSTITAKAAVDSLWVDNKFNLAGFRNSFNLINILDVADQTFAIDTKPTYNNAAGTVAMNIKIKYFYDENGLIVANTAATPMIISGFTPGPNIVTNITVKSSYLDSIVVDKWLSYVTVDEKISRTKIEEFLTLTGVPVDVEFTIANSNPINKTGVLTFNISTSKTIDDQGKILNTPSDPFPITLNLTPRITKMTAITTGYPSNLSAADLKAKLFNEDGSVIDLNELSKYLIVVAPVDGAVYHLVADSWEPSDDGEKVRFSIWVDKYYDLDGNEQMGTATSIANRIDFDLQLTAVAIVPTEDQFPWWWIIIGIGGAAIIGVGIWFAIKKRKEAEAKPADGEPNSKDPKDDEKKTSETEAKSEEAAKTDNHPIDKIAEETKTEEASKPKSLKKTKK